jgi:hypothetical protein
MSEWAKGFSRRMYSMTSRFAGILKRSSVTSIRKVIFKTGIYALSKRTVAASDTTELDALSMRYARRNFMMTVSLKGGAITNLFASAFALGSLRRSIAPFFRLLERSRPPDAAGGDFQVTCLSDANGLSGTDLLIPLAAHQSGRLPDQRMVSVGKYG